MENGEIKYKSLETERYEIPQVERGIWKLRRLMRVSEYSHYSIQEAKK